MVVTALAGAAAWILPQGRWEQPSVAANVAGYRVYWRATDSPTWDNGRWVGPATEHRFDGLVIDNYFCGVAVMGHDGTESAVAFQSSGG